MKNLSISLITFLLLSVFVPQVGANDGGELFANHSQSAKTNIYKEIKIPLPNIKPLASTSPNDVPLVTGAHHTCALVEGGGVKCWGSNSNGQLGDGTKTDSSTPVDVSGLNSSVTALAAGGYFTCALTNTGAVKCWGSNSSGQLGDDSTTERITPVAVKNLSGVTALAAGNYHSCALTDSGGLKCWGENSDGQLGDATFIQRKKPVDVNGLGPGSGATSVAAGGGHTCAVTSAGGVMCWGQNYQGQVGNGSTTVQEKPVNVSGLTIGVSAVAAGEYHTCAVTDSGRVKCWGSNDSGQLGDSTNNQSSTPVFVSGLTSGATSVTTGYSFTCAVINGSAKCWGNNGNGQLGDGTTTNRNSPIAVVGLSGEPKFLAGGSVHTCTKVKSGQIMCWGWNQYGQLGAGYSSIFSTPVDVTSLESGVTVVTAGQAHACAVVNGGAKCWGSNGNGRLGNGGDTSSSTPVDVSGLSNGVTAISAGDYHTCAVVNGGAKCWGDNISGQLGNGSYTSSSTPVNVKGLASGVIAISAGDFHTCALTSAGGAKCWGYNDNGQLGDTTTTESNQPVNVNDLASGVTAISAGGYHTCAVVNGSAKCWGYNDYGQLGNNDTTQSSTPVNVSGLSSGVTSIAGGEYFACAIVSGGAKCWGNNGDGQLGDGTMTQHKKPIDVTGLDSEVTRITAGYYSTCAIVSSGVKCWGDNDYGQLGNGDANDSSTPVNVSGMSSAVNDVEAGARHNCAATSAGSVRCWGNNEEGQLGNGKSAISTSPLVVSGAGPPAVNSLIPGSAIVGGPAFTLTVNGTGFVDGLSTVRWNGSDRTTTFVSDSKLTANINTTDITAVGTADLTVFNSGSGGGLSNAFPFRIDMFYCLPVVAKPK